MSNHIRHIYVCIHIYLYIYSVMCTCIYLYVYTYICIYTRMIYDIYVHVYMYNFMYIYLYICICKFIYMYSHKFLLYVCVYDNVASLPPPPNRLLWFLNALGCACVCLCVCMGVCVYVCCLFHISLLWTYPVFLTERWVFAGRCCSEMRTRYAPQPPPPTVFPGHFFSGEGRLFV